MSERSDNKAHSVRKHHEALASTRRTFLAGMGAVAGASTLGTAQAVDDPRDAGDPNRPVRNAILLIPDGAGRAQISAARYLKAYQDDPDAFPQNISPRDVGLHADRAEQIGTMSTYPDDPGLGITDSGAAGTAMATGCKTYNGAISVTGTPDGYEPTETLLQKAREAGMATGLVTTTRITHATPASFATHVPDRDMEDEIAEQYIDAGTVDVLMGGGREHFDPEEREDGTDLLARAEAEGYQLVETADQLENVSDGKVLGLFGSDQDRTSHMSYYLERLYEEDNTEPTLYEMTEKAIEILESCEHGRRNGFFLMVEAGRVDHQGHIHDPGIAAEQLECDETFGTILDYAEDDSAPPTLAVQVADHETGGLSLGWDAYDIDWDVVANQRASTERLMDEIESIDAHSGYYEEISAIVEEWAGFEPNQGELIELNQDPESINDVLNRRSRLGWSSDSHTGEEVPLYASGPNAEFFGNYVDNTDLVVGFAEALGIDAPAC